MTVYFYFFKTFFQFIFTSNKRSFLIWHDLLKKFSYRYAAKDKYRMRIFPTYFKGALALLFDKNNYIKYNSKNVLLLELTSRAEAERREYAMALLKDQQFDFVSKDNLPNDLSLFQKILFAVSVLNISFFSLFLSVFYKNKANIALLPLEYVELLLLNHFLEKNKFSKVIFFSAYEKDAVFMSAYIKEWLKLPIQLVPSPNPVNNFYKHVICTEFTFTVPYQRSEYEILKENWLIDGVIEWPPAGFTGLLKTINRITAKNTIGYISSGNWLRKELGHNDTNKGLLEAEDNILDYIAKFIRKNNHIKLLISLHPLEKRNEVNLAKAKAYFDRKFGDSIDFFPFNKSTNDYPEFFDVAISAYSSAMFARLFAGYKVLFSQKGMAENYFYDKRLHALTANDYQVFEDLLEDILNISSTSYFNKYNLSSYNHNKAILNEQY